MVFFVFFFTSTCVTGHECYGNGQECDPNGWYLVGAGVFPMTCCDNDYSCSSTQGGNGPFYCTQSAEEGVGVRKEGTIGLPQTRASRLRPEEGSHSLALDSARTLEATRALAAKANMQTEAIGTGYNLGEITIMALAVVGSITVVVKVFTACTRKEEYKAVLGDKNVEQPEEI